MSNRSAEWCRSGTAIDFLSGGRPVWSLLLLRPPHCPGPDPAWVDHAVARWVLEGEVCLADRGEDDQIIAERWIRPEVEQGWRQLLRHGHPRG